eukprot:3024834-Alexandrium_andersonii.AAC.1
MAWVGKPRRSLRCLVKVSSGPRIQPERPRSQHAQRAKRPSPRLRIGESRRPLWHTFCARPRCHEHR